MLKNETPEEWKTTCFLYEGKKLKDRYGYISLSKGGKATEIKLCVQPLQSEIIANEYGIELKNSIEAVCFDKEVNYNRYAYIACNGILYKIKGVMEYISYNLLVAERVKNV